MKTEIKAIIAFVSLLVIVELSFYFSMAIDIPFSDFSVLRWVIGTLLALIFLLLGQMAIKGKVGISSLWLLFSLLEYSI